ncbi:recombinase family protein [Natrialbaceae archaeon A-CW3]
MIDNDLIRKRVTTDEEAEPLRAAIYARTSTKKQKFGYSIEAQINRSNDRCETLGWEVLFVYRDEAESGKDTDRPMFQKMLAAAERQAFDVIVFWKLDRFSRSLLHAVQLEEELREYDVRLYSVTEQIDTTSATGRFNFRNLASAAEFERDMAQQRTIVSLNQIATENKWPNDNPPIGYDRDSTGKLSIVDNEKELVEQIFELYIEYRSMPDVAAELNEQELQVKDDREWTRRTISDILRNELYIGQYELGEVSEHVPKYQIIKDEVFEEVTTIRTRFQREEGSVPSMSDPRKEQMVKKVRREYDDYLEPGE